MGITRGSCSFSTYEDAVLRVYKLVRPRIHKQHQNMQVGGYGECGVMPRDEDEDIELNCGGR